MNLPSFHTHPALYFWGFAAIMCMALVAFMPEAGA
jgi:hypothetical protein